MSERNRHVLSDEQIIEMHSDIKLIRSTLTGCDGQEGVCRQVTKNTRFRLIAIGMSKGLGIISLVVGIIAGVIKITL